MVGRAALPCASLERPTGTVTFLFTDVEGSTRLWEDHAEEMQRALGAHDELVRRVVADHDGYVFATGGDGFAVAFGRPQDAVAAARAIQNGLTGLDAPFEVRVRMGLHTGAAEERDGNYFGPPVNRAARIMAAGHGGQILASAAVRDLVDGGDGFLALGTHRLKDLGSQVALFQLGEGSFPPPRSLDHGHHNLPVRSIELIGREAEVATSVELIGRERLVTLAGVGGTGKTSLALAAAAEAADSFDDGVWFIDLVPVSALAGIVAAVTAETGLRPSTNTTSALLELLAERRLLLVLDNCEHVVDDVADFVDELLATTRAPHVLATSREPLDVSGERVVHVPPLAVDGDDDPPAVRLFRTRAAEAGATLDAGDDATIRSICRHLDGLPLAIELAAGQLVHMRPAEIEVRLDQRFEILTREGRGRRRRHRSLEGVLAETWDLLAEGEAALVVALTVFPSTFDLAAVEGTCRDVVPAPAATLRELVRNALVATTGDENGATRYRLLETVKLFARRVAPEGAVAAQRDRHLDWIVATIQSVPLAAQLTSLSFSDWWRSTYEDSRVAENHALACGRVDDAVTIASSGALAWYGNTSGQAQDGLTRLDRLLALPELSDAQRAALRLAAALAAMGARRHDRLVSDAEQAVELAERAGDDVVLSRALLVRAWTAGLGDVDAGLDLLDRSVDHARRAGADRLVADALAYRPVFLALGGRTEQAMDEVAVLLDADVDHDNVAVSTLALGWNMALLERPALAARALERTAVLENAERSWGARTMDSLIAASDADLEAALTAMRDARRLALRTGVDDGLPDLLLVPAMAALRIGDAARCARYLGAVRASPKRTQHFGFTLLYRVLRGAVGLPDDLTDLGDTDGIYAEAEAWLDGMTGAGTPLSP